MMSMSKDDVSRVQHGVQGLAADLSLIDKLDKVRGELDVLDNKCAFYEGIYGREHPEYLKVHAERDALLLHANGLLELWIKERAHLPTPRA